MLCHPPRTTGAAAPGSVSRGDVTPAGPAASGRGVYTHESKHNPSFRCNSDQMCRKGSAKVLPTPERFLFSLILQTPNVQVVCPSGKKRSRPSGQLLGWHAKCISAVCAIGACDVASGACGLWPGLGARPHPVSKDEGGAHLPLRGVLGASPETWGCSLQGPTQTAASEPRVPRAGRVWGGRPAGVCAGHRCHTGARPRRRCVSAPVTLGFTDPGPGAGGQAAAVPARPPTGAASRPSCRTVPYPSSEPEPPLYDSSSSRQ